MKLPELADKAQLNKDLSRFRFCLSSPVRIEPIRIPSLRQAPALFQSKDCAPRETLLLAPAPYVFFRPEEQNRGSCKTDIIPPVGGWYGKVNHAGVIGECPLFNFHRERLPTIRAPGHDLCLPPEQGGNPERIPGAVGIPPAFADRHTVGSGNSRERHGHPNVQTVGMENQHVLLSHLLVCRFY
jgi:hypothetical protein